jgi:hypothetical protein
MKKLRILVLLVAALAALSLSSARADDVTVNVTLAEQNASGESGTATITDMHDGTVKVVLHLSGGNAGTTTPQPAHIHDGTCAQLDPKPTYPLSNVVSGMSETIVKATMEDLLHEPYAINIHKSGPEASVYVSYGDIIILTTAPGMPTTGNGDLLCLAGGLLLAALALTGMGLALRRTRA